MNRRGFLSLLAPAAALIVAPELLIPRRTFFLPPTMGWSISPEMAYLDGIYRRYSGYEALVPAEIIQITLRNHQDAMLNNILKNNALLQRLRQ